MSLSSNKKWIVGATALGLIGISAVDAQQQRLPRECRKEIVAMCGMDRSQMRSCITQKMDQLSEDCRTQLMQRAKARMSSSERQAAQSDTKLKSTGGQELSYGTATLQKADFWAGRSRNAPLVLFVHGGGWKRGDKNMMTGSAKLTDWQGKGYAVASINYRLVPDASVEDQASDVAASIAFFRRNSAKLGIDPSRIVLIGHSAGAHLVALVGTDPKWLSGAGLTMNAVAGVVPLDGAAYNVADQMDENARLMGDTYKQAFGTDPARQAALSPTLHAAKPNAPAFLILHVQRKDGVRQSTALAKALQEAGTSVQLAQIKGRGLPAHAEINRKLGEPDYPATPLVDSFLKERFYQ